MPGPDGAAGNRPAEWRQEAPRAKAEAEAKALNAGASRPFE